MKPRHCSFVIGLLLLGACGDEPVAPLSPEPDPCSEQADIDACRINQQACGELAGDVTCTACSEGEWATPAGLCEAIGGTAMKHEFAEFTTSAGEEILGLCQSWTLGNETDIWVNTVELQQDALSHHSNWTFSPEDEFPGEDGVWPCDERDYDQLTAAVAGGVIYAQSTQAVREVQKFPDGAAVRIPAHSRIIGDVHVLNTSDESRTGHTALTLYTLSEAEVATRLAPFHLTYDELAIPPHSSSRFSGTCELATPWQEIAGEPLSMKLYYSLPHTHALGTRMFLRASGGPRDGETLLDVVGFNGEARGKNYEPPVDLTGITGLEFGCEFENPRDDVVHWGFGDQEMCEMLGFIESPLGFESRISEAIPGDPDGEMPTFSGECNTVLIPWDEKL